MKKMEQKLKKYYVKLIVAVEITVLIFVFNFLVSNAEFEDLVAQNVLVMMIGTIFLHILVYDIFLIIMIVSEKKALKIKNN